MRAGGTARDSSGRRGWSGMRHWRGEAKTWEKEAPAPGPVWRDELEQEEEPTPEANQ